MDSWPHSPDVLVAGGGNAALCAAITARQAGASVLVLESAPRVFRGGNSRHTRNLRYAHPGADGIVTGPYPEDEFWDDLLRVTGGRTSEALARRAIHDSVELPSWMVRHGVRFQPPLSGTLHLGRTNGFFLGGGKALESRELVDRMTVADNLAIGAHCRRDAAGVARTCQQVYELFPILGERRQQIAGSLSGGEQQMCAIGRALMAAPTLLVVDEMSLGLAPVVVDRLLDVLVRVRDQGTTVLLVEQDVFAAFSIADRAYVMETGRIVREGSAAELQQDADVRKAYLGVQ